MTPPTVAALLTKWRELAERRGFSMDPTDWSSRSAILACADELEAYLHADPEEPQERTTLQSLCDEAALMRADPDEPCANGHVWSNQFGDDYTPDYGTPCDCKKKQWGIPPLPPGLAGADARRVDE